MGASALAVIGGSLLAAKPVGKAVGSLLGIEPPKPPRAPQLPPAVDPQQADAAAARARRRALSAGGRSSTILTGPGGLTEPAPGQRKTLLGG